MRARSRRTIGVAAALGLSILLLITGALPVAASWTAPTIIDSGRTIEGALVGVDDGRWVPPCAEPPWHGPRSRW